MNGSNFFVNGKMVIQFNIFRRLCAWDAPQVHRGRVSAAHVQLTLCASVHSIVERAQTLRRVLRAAEDWGVREPGRVAEKVQQL